MRVHVVEDDQHLRGSLERLLSAAGYQVRAWGDADAAVAAMTGAMLVEVVLADGLRTASGADMLDALLAAGVVAAGVRFGSGADGPSHDLEIVRLTRITDSGEVLRAVARAAKAANDINVSIAAAGLLPAEVEHVIDVA